MKDENVNWVPGTDHAGIATQALFDRELQRSGERKEDIGREMYVDMVGEKLVLIRETHQQTITKRTSLQPLLQRLDPLHAGVFSDQLHHLAQSLHSHYPSTPTNPLLEPVSAIRRAFIIFLRSDFHFSPSCISTPLISSFEKAPNVSSRRRVSVTQGPSDPFFSATHADVAAKEGIVGA